MRTDLHVSPDYRNPIRRKMKRWLMDVERNIFDTLKNASLSRTTYESDTLGFQKQGRARSSHLALRSGDEGFTFRLLKKFGEFLRVPEMSLAKYKDRRFDAPFSTVIEEASTILRIKGRSLVLLLFTTADTRSEASDEGDQAKDLTMRVKVISSPFRFNQSPSLPSRSFDFTRLSKNAAGSISAPILLARGSSLQVSSMRDWQFRLALVHWLLVDWL